MLLVVNLGALSDIAAMVTPKSLGFTYEAIGQGWWVHCMDGMSTQLTNHNDE
jgi:hypothetical protein